MLHLILFLIFGAICVAGAVNLIAQTHPINSALSLVVVMGSLAAEYLLLGAEFVAAVQVIVYAGAIMVLFVFVIMLLNAGEEEHTKGSRVALLIGIPGMLIGSVLIGWVLLDALRHAAGRGRISSRTSPNHWLAPVSRFPAALRSDLHFGVDRDYGCRGAGGSAGIRAAREEGGLMVPLSYYLLLGGILFACGVIGFLIKRNIITIFMSIELMLNGVNLSFVAFAAQWHALSGQVFVFFVMVVAAAEAAVGLAIIIAVYRTRETLNVDHVNLLKL